MALIARSAVMQTRLEELAEKDVDMRVREEAARTLKLSQTLRD